MKKRVAVATVQGKTYFLIVSILKEKGIPFISLMPADKVPADIKVVITTQQEKHHINHENVLSLGTNVSIDTVLDETIKILRGKKRYERIIVGVDPGDVYGLAVIADGKTNETKNCFSNLEVLNSIKRLLEHTDFSLTEVCVKIGNGVSAYKDLLETLDAGLPHEVILEVVSEAGTNQSVHGAKHRRGPRDIASAKRIAGRSGHIYSRRPASYDSDN